MKSPLLSHRRFVGALYHSVVVLFSVITAFLLRFDFSIPPSDISVFGQAIIVGLAVKMPIFLVSGVHRGWWRFVTIFEFIYVSLVNLLASLSFALAAILVLGGRVPRSVFVVDYLLCLLLTTGLRF